MSDPQTTNLGLYSPTRGSDSGTWDLPVNANAAALDGLFCNVFAIALTSGNLTILTTPPNSGAAWAGPYGSQSAVVRLSGALTIDARLELPRPGFYLLENLCTFANNAVVLVGAASAGEFIALPPGETVQVYCDGFNIRFVNFGRIGEYIDLASPTTPRWISACTKPPYLLCDGSTFSAVTYPFLNSILGGTTLPDLRGRFRAMMNLGTGRISASGVDGNTIFAAGGADTRTIAQANLPAYNLAVTDPQHAHGLPDQMAPHSSGGGSAFNALTQGSGTGYATNPAPTGISVNLDGGGQVLPTIPPVQMAGITLVRAN